MTSYMSSSTSATYSYNAQNLRMSATTNGITQNYTWSTSDQLLGDGSNYYVYGPSGAPIEQVNQSTGAATYLYTDQLGSVVMEADDSGNVTGTQSYSQYGSLASQTGAVTTPFGFAGGYTDPTGLIYLINRYYDPQTGQFTSVDADVESSHQPYSYAAGDPINSKDPNGLLVSGECVSGTLGVIWTITAELCHVRDLNGGSLYTKTTGHGIGLGISISYGSIWSTDASNVDAILGPFFCVQGSGDIGGAVCKGEYQGCPVHTLNADLGLGAIAADVWTNTKKATGLARDIAEILLP